MNDSKIRGRDALIAQATSFIAKGLHQLRMAYVTDQSGDEHAAAVLRQAVEQCETILTDDHSGLLNFLGRRPLPPNLPRDPAAMAVYTVKYLDEKTEETYVYKTGPIGDLPEAFVTARHDEYAYASPLAALVALTVYSGVPFGGDYETLK